MSTSGDIEIAALFIAVGYALTIWEELDARLQLMFQHLRQQRSAVDVDDFFYELRPDGGRRDRSLPKKIKLLMTEIDYLNDKQLSGLMGEIVNHISKAAKRRNEIGHGVVMSLNYGACGANPSLSGNYLVSKEASIPFAKKEFCALTSTQIICLAHKVRDLRGGVDDVFGLLICDLPSERERA